MRLLRLAAGMSPNVSSSIGQTGLHVAAIWGCVEVSEVLLQARRAEEEEPNE